MSTDIKKSVVTGFDSILTILAFPLEAGPGPTDIFHPEKQPKNWRGTQAYADAHTVGGGPFPKLVEIDVVVPPATTLDNFTFGKAYLTVPDFLGINMAPPNYIYPPGTKQQPPVAFALDLTKIKPGYYLTNSMTGNPVLYNPAMDPTSNPTPAPPPVGGGGLPDSVTALLARIGRWLDAMNVPQ